MTDLFGETPPREPFKDIRNQRESVAQEKARLCAELNALLRKTPPAKSIGSAQQVTAFRHSHKAALKVLQAKASSRQELQSAISSMSAWFDKEAA